MPISVDFLKSLPFFKSLNEAEIEHVSKKVIIISADRGQIVSFEGESSRGLYAVKEGKVRIFKSSPEGREQVLRIVEAGETFNEVSVFDGLPNPASASSLEASVIYLIPKDVLLSLVAGCPVALIIINLMAGRIRHLNSMIENLSFRSVVSRVAKLLLDMAVTETGPAPVPRLTQDDMAAMVGSVRDVVGRALKLLEKNGAIQIQGHRIVVVSTQKLKEKL